MSAASETPGAFDRLMEEGNALFELKRYTQARERFHRAVAADPDAAEPWTMLSLVALHLDEHREALSAAEEGGRREPEWYFPHSLRAHALLALGRGESAYESATTCVACDPEEPDALATLYWCALGLERRREAEAVARELQRLAPNDDRGPAFLGELAQMDGDFEDAELYYREALRLDPEDPRTLKLLGTLHAEKEEHGESVDLLGMAVRERPDDADYQELYFGALLQALVRGRRGNRRHALGVPILALTWIASMLCATVSALWTEFAWGDEPAWLGWAYFAVLPVLLAVSSPLVVRHVRRGLSDREAFITRQALVRSGRRWGLASGTILGLLGLVMGGGAVAGAHEIGEVISVVVGVPAFVAASVVWLWCIASSLIMLALVAREPRTWLLGGGGPLAVAAKWTAILAPMVALFPIDPAPLVVSVLVVVFAFVLSWVPRLFAAHSYRQSIRIRIRRPRRWIAGVAIAFALGGLEWLLPSGWVFLPVLSVLGAFGTSVFLGLRLAPMAACGLMLATMLVPIPIDAVDGSSRVLSVLAVLWGASPIVGFVALPFVLVKTLRRRKEQRRIVTLLGEEAWSAIGSGVAESIRNPAPVR